MRRYRPRQSRLRKATPASPCWSRARELPLKRSPPQAAPVSLLASPASWTVPASASELEMSSSLTPEKAPWSASVACARRAVCVRAPCSLSTSAAALGMKGAYVMVSSSSAEASAVIECTCTRVSPRSAPCSRSLARLRLIVPLPSASAPRKRSCSLASTLEGGSSARSCEVIISTRISKQSGANSCHESSRLPLRSAENMR
mmetsp:Transcript_8766/g.28907  ORF Transcript_8766/g.28907 Transcript_8766/m.28907 type:complete len:202 (+) Transcript_8766:344-949(+)